MHGSLADEEDRSEVSRFVHGAVKNGFTGAMGDRTVAGEFILALHMVLSMGNNRTLDRRAKCTFELIKGMEVSIFYMIIRRLMSFRAHLSHKAAAYFVED